MTMTIDQQLEYLNRAVSLSFQTALYLEFNTQVLERLIALYDQEGIDAVRKEYNTLRM